MLTPCPSSSYLLRKGTPMRLRLRSTGPGTPTARSPAPLAGLRHRHTQQTKRTSGMQWQTATRALEAQPAPCISAARAHTQERIGIRPGRQCEAGRKVGKEMKETRHATWDATWDAVRPQSPHAHWASGKRMDESLRGDQLTVVQEGPSAQAGKQVRRWPEGGNRTKHYLQAEQSSGVVELPSAHLSMVVLIWLWDLINPQHHKDLLWPPRPYRFIKNQEVNNHFQNIKTAHCKMCFRKMSVSKNSFCLPRCIIQNFQASASSELPLLMWIETMIKTGIFQNPKFQTHPVHFQPTVQKSAAWIQNVTGHLDMTSMKIHKFCSDQHFNCYLCHSIFCFFLRLTLFNF